MEGADHVLALYRYERLSGRILVAAKNRDRRDLLRGLGRELGVAVRDGGLGPFDAVTWVPASPAGRARRGFDQGRILARTASRCGLGPPVRLLARAGVGRSGRQDRRGLGRSERLVGPAIATVRAVPASVLVIDDVITTGASMSAAARSLRAAGAVRVTVAAVARADG